MPGKDWVLGPSLIDHPHGHVFSVIGLISIPGMMTGAILGGSSVEQTTDQRSGQKSGHSSYGYVFNNAGTVIRTAPTSASGTATLLVAMRCTYLLSRVRYQIVTWSMLVLLKVEKVSSMAFRRYFLIIAWIKQIDFFSILVPISNGFVYWSLFASSFLLNINYVLP